MITPELIEFIKREEAKGVSRESIISLLRTQSWTEVDIMEAFDSIPPIASNLNQTTMQNIPQAVRSVDATPSNIFVSPVKPRKKVAIISVALIIILLVGGSLAYASGYLVPLETIFSKSVQLSRENTSLALNMHMTVDASGVKGSEQISKLVPGLSPIFNLDAKGSYETLDKNNLKSESSFSLSSGTVEAGFDFRVVDGSFYMKINKTPTIGFFSLKPIENRWITIPKSGSDSVDQNPLSSISGVNSEFLNKLTEEQKQHIADITNKAKFINITNKHLPAVIDGSPTFHFNFNVNTVGVVSYLKELIAYMKTIDKNTDQLSSISDSDLDKIPQSLKNFHGEAWVGVFDHLPRKVTVSFDAMNPDTPSDGVFKVTMSVDYSNFNKPVIVEAPKDATTIEKLMSEMMGGSMFGDPSNGMPQAGSPIYDSQLEDARSKGQDATIKSIESTLRAQAEVYYDSNANSYKGFCSSKGQYGAYTFAKTLPSGTVYKCNDSVSNWASWSKLSTGEYYCVDSAGIAESIVGLPQGVSCPSR